MVAKLSDVVLLHHDGILAAKHLDQHLVVDFLEQECPLSDKETLVYSIFIFSPSIPAVVAIFNVLISHSPQMFVVFGKASYFFCRLRTQLVQNVQIKLSFQQLVVAIDAIESIFDTFLCVELADEDALLNATELLAHFFEIVLDAPIL